MSVSNILVPGNNLNLYSEALSTSANVVVGGNVDVENQMMVGNNLLINQNETGQGLTILQDGVNGGYLHAEGTTLLDGNLTVDGVVVISNNVSIGTNANPVTFTLNGAPLTINYTLLSGTWNFAGGATVAGDVSVQLVGNRVVLYIYPFVYDITENTPNVTYSLPLPDWALPISAVPGNDNVMEFTIPTYSTSQEDNIGAIFIGDYDSFTQDGILRLYYQANNLDIPFIFAPGTNLVPFRQNVGVAVSYNIQ